MSGNSKNNKQITLAEDENVISEISLTTSENKSNYCTLTNKRLVVVWKNAQEFFPLSKITSIGLYKEKDWGAIIIGLALGVAGVSLGDFDQGSLLLLGSRLGMALGGAVLFFGGLAGSTYIVISHMAGTKKYEVKGGNKDIQSFIDVLNHQLS